MALTITAYIVQLQEAADYTAQTLEHAELNDCCRKGLVRRLRAAIAADMYPTPEAVQGTIDKLAAELASGHNG